MEISAIELKSFAKNYIEGVYKVTEFTFYMSGTTREIVNSRALMMSSDRGTTKRIMHFASRDDTVSNHNSVLKDAKKIIVLYQFLDLPAVPPIKREYEDIDRENNSVTYIVDDEILRVGTTRLIQHVYIDYGNRRFDVGSASARIETSFIDSNESGLGGLEGAMSLKDAEALFDFSVEGE